MRRFDREVASRVALLAPLYDPLFSPTLPRPGQDRAVPRDRSTQRAGIEDPLAITHGRLGAGAGGH